MSLPAVAAVGLAVVLDTAVGEPPNRLHPVAWFGRLVGRVDRTYERPLLAGTAIAVTLPLAVACGIALAIAAIGSVWIAALCSGVVLFVTTSLRMLIRTARTVVLASDADTEVARASVPALVGRDPSALSPGELRSAAVESAAENLADGLVAPLVAFAVAGRVGIAFGAGAAVWVKAVNTLDSMLGYPENPHGTPSARLDDVVMWVPARLSALLVAVAALSPRSLARARGYVSAPPSPNSGWPMATLAAVLRVRLEKPGVYTLFPEEELPTKEQSVRGVRTVTRAGGLAVGLAGVSLWL